MNDKIKAKEVRLIDHDGTQLGVVTFDKAQELAAKSGLDIMLVSDTSTPPVCRIIDFGHFKYQQQKKDKQNKKNTKSQTTKEIKFGPKISENDLHVKINRAIDFLKKGYKVKASVFFRGREIVHYDLGKNLIDRFIENILEFGVSNLEPSKPNDRSIITIINPK